MKCKVAEQGQLSLSGPKWVKEEQRGARLQTEKGINPQGGKGQQADTSLISSIFLVTRSNGTTFTGTNGDGNHQGVTHLTAQTLESSRLLALYHSPWLCAPFCSPVTLEANPAIKINQTGH